MSRTKTSTIALRTTKYSLDLFKNIKNFSNEDYIYNLREDNLIKKLLILLLNQYFSFNINKLEIIKYFESINIFTDLNIDKNTQKLNLLKFINEKNNTKKLSLILYNNTYISENIINKKKIILYNNLISKQLYTFKTKKLILNKLLILNSNNKRINLKKNIIKKHNFINTNYHLNYTLNLYNIYYYFLLNILKNNNIVNLLKNKKFIFIFYNIFNKIQNIFFKNTLNFKILKNNNICNTNIKSLKIVENNSKILNKIRIKNTKNNLIIIFQLIFNYYNLKNNNNYKIFYKFLINDLIIIYLKNSNYNIKKNINNYINIYIKNYYILLQFKTNLKINYFSVKYLKTKLFNINKLQLNNIKILINNINTNINNYKQIEIIPNSNIIKNNINNIKFLTKSKNKYLKINKKVNLKKNQIILKNNKKCYKIFILKIKKNKKIKYFTKKHKKSKNKYNLIKKSNYLKNLKLNKKNLNYYLNHLCINHIKIKNNYLINKNIIYNKLLLKKIKNFHKYNNKIKTNIHIKKNIKIQLNNNNINKQFGNNYRIILKLFIKSKYILKLLNLKYILNKHLKIKKFNIISLNYKKRHNILNLKLKNYSYKNKLVINFYFNNKKQFINYKIRNKELQFFQLKLNNNYLYKKQYLHNLNLNINSLNFYNKMGIFNYYLLNNKTNFNEISKKIYFDFNNFLNYKNKKKLLQNNNILINKYLNRNILILTNFKYKYLIKTKNYKNKKNTKKILNKQYKLDLQYLYDSKNITINFNNLLKNYYKKLNTIINNKKYTNKYYHQIFKLFFFNKNLTINIKLNYLKYYIILNNLLKIKNNNYIINYTIYYNNIIKLQNNNILSYLYLQKLLKNSNKKYTIINNNIIYNYFNVYLNNIKLHVNNKKLIHISYKNFVKNSKLNLKQLLLKNKLIKSNSTNIYKRINKKIYNFENNLKIKNILLKQLYNLKYLYLLNKGKCFTQNLSYFDLYDYDNLKKNQLIKLFLDFNFLIYSKTNKNNQLFETLIYPLFNKHLRLSYKKKLINIILNFEQIFKIINYFKNINNKKIFLNKSLININNQNYSNNFIIKNNYINILISKFFKYNNLILSKNSNKFYKYSKNFELYKHYTKKISTKYNTNLSKKQLSSNYIEYQFNKNINTDKIKKQNLIYKNNRTINNLLLFYNFLCIYKYQKYLIKKILKKLNLKIGTLNNLYFIQKKYIKYILLNNYIKIYKNLNFFFFTKLNKTNKINFNKLICKYSSLNSNYYYYTDLLNIFNKNNIILNNINEYNILYPDLFLNNYLNKLNYIRIKNLNQKLTKASIILDKNIITNNYLSNTKFNTNSLNINYYISNNILYISDSVQNTLIDKLLILHKKHLNINNLKSLNININHFFYTIIKNYYLLLNKFEDRYINIIISKKNTLLEYIFNKNLYINLYENQEFINIKQLMQNFDIFIKYICFLNIYYVNYKHNYIRFYNNYNIFSLLFFSNFLDYIFKKSNYLQFLFYKLNYKNNNLSKVVGLYLLLYKYSINPKLVNIDIILNYIFEFLNIQIKSNSFYKFSNLKKNLYLFENIFNDFIKTCNNITGIQFSIKGKTLNTTLRKKKYIIQKGYLNLNNIDNLIDYSQKIINGKYGKLCFRLYISTNILK